MVAHGSSAVIAEDVTVMGSGDYGISADGKAVIEFTGGAVSGSAAQGARIMEQVTGRIVGTVFADNRGGDVWNDARIAFEPGGARRPRPAAWWNSSRKPPPPTAGARRQARPPRPRKPLWHHGRGRQPSNSSTRS